MSFRKIPKIINTYKKEKIRNYKRSSRNKQWQIIILQSILIFNLFYNKKEKDIYIELPTQFIVVTAVKSGVSIIITV